MGNFQTTRWSLVLAARADHADARDALDALCRAYHPAVLAYVRGWGYSRADAEDLTQGFFARFLEKRVHAAADPARGRFRVFLRTALHNFILNTRGKATAARRKVPNATAGPDPDELATEADADLPERAFERAWALLVVNRALQRLRREAKGAGKADLFAQLQGFMLEPPAPDDYARIARELGTRPNTIAVATHRMRQRLHELVRVELADTVADADEVDGEYEALLGSIRQPAARAGRA